MEIVAGHGDFRYVELYKEASRTFLVLLKVGPSFDDTALQQWGVYGVVVE